ncbi:MAG: ABC transporter permease [Rubricella sp.]
MSRLQRYQRNDTFAAAALSFTDLLYVSIVREFRSENGGAIMSFFWGLARPMMIFIVFWLLYEVIGRGALIRGDFIMFMLSGIFLYLLHIRAVKNLKGVGHSAAGMIFYARASTLLNILASALHELYVSIISIAVILTMAYLLRGYLEVYDPTAVLLPFFIAWASGFGVGLVFLAVTPLLPRLAPLLFNAYRRIQMFTSGKMFLANYLPSNLIVYFSWNPLFHCIDQARGAIFINYLPRYTNMEYPVYFTLVAITIGLIVEYALRAARDRGLE